MKQKIWERLYWYTGWFYDFSNLATMILIVILVTNYFVFSFLIVRGKSMYPNYDDGNLVLVNKYSYVFGSPQRGDSVAMYFPGEASKRFIKRVIGLPNDTLKIEMGKVYVNGQGLEEKYLPSDLATLPDMQKTLGSDEYFVMGDNRNFSSDSRAWGTVPKNFIVGKALNIVASL